MAFVAVLVAGLSACSQLAPDAPGLAPQSVTAAQGSTRTLTLLGSSRFTATTMGTPQGAQAPELPPFDAEQDGNGADGQGAGSGSASYAQLQRFVNRIPDKRDVPIAPPQGTSGEGGAAPRLGNHTSFEGLNHFDERSADNGNQFSLEPPDQGLCAGPAYVLEAVNDVLQVYGTDGTPHGVVSLNQFFYDEHAIDRTQGTTAPFGHFVTDPSCLYDASTERWFLVVLTLDVDPVSGAFTGTNHLDLAVSRTPDPLADWAIYSLDVSHDGSPKCAAPSGPTGYCLGDYPHFAVNADGLFITTDSFPFFTNGYNGAWLYGIQKSALVDGNDAAVYATALPTFSGASYSVAPALATGTSQGDVEYLVSATTANTSSSNKVAVWAVTNTASLDTSRPSLRVASALVGVGGSHGFGPGGYADPPEVPQKSGDIPYGTYLGASEGLIATNDSGMKQAVFVNGHLYSALTTVADNGAGVGGGPGAGIAWFDLVPSFGANGRFTASLAGAGVVAPQGRNLIFPAITLAPNGTGAIAATLVGADDYPSAAVLPFDVGGAGDAAVVMEGFGPQDGFSEYGGRPRWGDYGAAVVDPEGNLWLASEAIHQTCTFEEFGADTTCDDTRSFYANWSTQITQVAKVTP